MIAGGVMLIVFILLVLITSCRAFVSVPGPLQTVQRAELWVSFLLYSLIRQCMLVLTTLVLFVILGDCLMVLLPSVPFELMTDGDLLILIRRMIDLRGIDSVRISKVKGHADEDMVADGRVRMVDRLGNHAADEAADFGRMRVCPAGY